MSTSAEARRFSPLAHGGPVDARDARQAAQALGYAEGWSTGTRAAAAQGEADRAALVRRHDAAAAAARADVEHALGALDAAARQLVRVTAPTLDEVGDVVLEAAVSLARAVLDAELSVVDDAALAALRRALRPLPTDSLVTVRVHPADHAVLEPALAEASDGTTSFGGHGVRLLADGSLARGDALAEQSGSLVDARVGAALDRALSVLRAAS